MSSVYNSPFSFNKICLFSQLLTDTDKQTVKTDEKLQNGNEITRNRCFFRIIAMKTFRLLGMQAQNRHGQVTGSTSSFLRPSNKLMHQVLVTVKPDKLTQIQS